MILFASILLLINLHVVISKDPYLTCDFAMDYHGYACYLKIYNPGGLNNFDKISGKHREGWKHENVQYIYHKAEWTGYTTNIPSILCDSLPNVRDITLHNIKLEKIEDRTFDNCKLLVEILLTRNNLNSISENALIENHELQTIKIFKNKKLMTLPEELFINQRKVQLLQLDQNLITDLPKKIFYNLRALEELWLSENNLKVLRAEWFENLESLKILKVFENPIEELSVNCFKNLKKLVELHMYKTQLTTLHSSSFGAHPSLKIFKVFNSKMFAIDYRVFNNINPDLYFDMEYNYCSGWHGKGFRSIMTNLKRCYENYDNSLAGKRFFRSCYNL